MKRTLYVSSGCLIRYGDPAIGSALGAWRPFSESIFYLQRLRNELDFDIVIVAATDDAVDVLKAYLTLLQGEEISAEPAENMVSREQLVQLLRDRHTARRGKIPVDVVVSADEDSSALAASYGAIGIRLAGSEAAAGWSNVFAAIQLPPRIATIERKTSETDIVVGLNLDGRGKSTITTGLGFFDHMLTQISRHAGCDLIIRVEGDLHVDEHHTIEDTALALGEAFSKALGEKRGLQRYGFLLPMDDALAQVAIDFSGRNWLVWDAEFNREKVGDMPTEMFYHFFKSFSDAARCNLNIRVRGDNEHHKIESVFKAFGRAIQQAIARNPDDNEIPSTKGIL